MAFKHNTNTGRIAEAVQRVAPIKPTRTFSTPAEMARVLGTSRYPQRGLSCADWPAIKAGKAPQ